MKNLEPIADKDFKFSPSSCILAPGSLLSPGFISAHLLTCQIEPLEEADQ